MVVKRPTLPREKRIAAARLSGAISRLTRGIDQGLSREQKLAALRTLTTDPQVLGDAMGVLLVGEFAGFAAADAEGIDLLRALGADETYGEAVAEWIRWKRGRDAAAPGPVL